MLASSVCKEWCRRLSSCALGGGEERLCRACGRALCTWTRTGRGESYASSVQRRALSSPGAMNVFDRATKRLQKNRAALSEDAEIYDYLRAAVASNIIDRVGDVSHFFPLMLDVGCGRGHIAKVTTSDITERLVQCDMAEQALLHSSADSGVPVHSVVADEEFLPFPSNMFDLAVSSLSLHWVNDLPQALQEILRVLKPDRPLVGAMFAGDTLFELRSSLQLAEIEREGGFAAHVSPFVQLADVGSLLNRAGFTITTLDTDEIQVSYPSMYELMADLKGMGESNCAWNRRHYIRKTTLTAAAAIYQGLYGNEDGSIPSTFQVLYFIGWKPHPSQMKAAKRGSASASFKDLSSGAGIGGSSSSGSR